jgi:hypothetical protein
MTTIYTIEITPHTEVLAGSLNLKISGKPMLFCFNTLAERQPLFELARSEGWAHTLDVLSTSTTRSAFDFLQRDYASLRESLHLHPKALVLPEGKL